MPIQFIVMPDVGKNALDVIEIQAVLNQSLIKEQTLLVVESEKTTLEIPAPFSGVIKKWLIKVGDSVHSGQVIAEMEVEELLAVEAKIPVISGVSMSASSAIKAKSSAVIATAHSIVSQVNLQVHAGPAVRRLAYELGVNLAQVKPTGPRGRILKEDIQAYVKLRLTSAVESSSLLPDVDFSQWGSIEKIALTTLAKASAKNLQRSWSVIPHVTQFEEVNITELEKLRKKFNADLRVDGIKLTLLAFILKAAADVLSEFPKFKASLSSAQDQLIIKHYCHIGFAVDTSHGLVVPVLRDVDHQSLQEIATALQTLSTKARAKKLLPQEMQGGCFTISSLGGLGGTQFTPIVNWPEVAILGVSRSQYKPMWDGQQFIPQLILPISLSYDHRIIDGADGVRFLIALQQRLENFQSFFT